MQELRSYFRSLGAEISEEKSPKGIEDDLHKIIGVCDACFKEGNEAEIGMILSDIVSIMIIVNIFFCGFISLFHQFDWFFTYTFIFTSQVVPTERAENLILAFCEKLTKAPGYKLGLVCLNASVQSCYLNCNFSKF